MTFLMMLWDLLLEGLLFLRNYLFFPRDGITFSLMRIFSLLIAFSISGAIITFMSQNAILKHLGPDAKPVTAYGVASVSGAILAVCSCSVLPMFASIRKKGAGIGPAIAFLFSGPAINVLAVILTFTDIGLDVAIARITSSILLSIVIGSIMFVIFRRSEQTHPSQSMFSTASDESSHLKHWQKVLFFVTLFLILIFGVYQPLPTIVLILLLLIQLIFFFNKADVMRWAKETYLLAKKIFPLFLIGIFAAGILSALVTTELISGYVGSNTYGSNLMASLAGALMYFATLTEVPIIQALIDSGMHKGPATALLLAGPSLSLPNMIIITKVIGFKRSSTYILLVVFLSALAGLIAGAIYI